MNTQIVAIIISEGAKLIGQYYRNRPIVLRHQTPEAVEKPPELDAETLNHNKATYGVSDAETIAYQGRELGKALLLMELHLQQKCKINGIPCDCCEKHPMAIEALAEEAFGMTGDAQYNDIMVWTKKVTPMTTTEASASGQYEEIYPELAQEARAYRKQLMGTEDITALVSPEDRERIKIETMASLKGGGDDES